MPSRRHAVTQSRRPMASAASLSIVADSVARSLNAVWMGGYFRGGRCNGGVGEASMYEALQDLGYEFERQHRVERWHIDLALWPLALEIERGFQLPHQDNNYAPDTFGGKKYSRLLSLLDLGWFVMAMRPPYQSGFDGAAQLVIDYLDRIKGGGAPRYVALQQHRNFGRWLRSEGTYTEGSSGWSTSTTSPRCSPPQQCSPCAGAG